MEKRGIELRKAQKIGSSVFVSLPKGWAKKAGVEPGDLLELVPEADGSLRIKPAEKLGRRLAVVNVEQPLDLTLPRALTCLYILGYDDIVLELPAAASSEVLARIRDALLKLPGFELVEATNKSVRIRCLTSLERVNDKELLDRYLSIINDELLRVIVANLRGERGRVDRSVALEERKLHSLLMRAMVGSRWVRTPPQAVKLVAASLMEVIADFMLAAARKAAELNEVDAEILSQAASAFEDFGKALFLLVPPLFSDDEQISTEGYLLLNSVERRAAELLSRSSGSVAIITAKLLDSARIASFIARMGFCAKRYMRESSSNSLNSPL